MEARALVWRRGAARPGQSPRRPGPHAVGRRGRRGERIGAFDSQRGRYRRCDAPDVVGPAGVAECHACGRRRGPDRGMRAPRTTRARPLWRVLASLSAIDARLWSLLASPGGRRDVDPASGRDSAGAVAPTRAGLCSRPLGLCRGGTRRRGRWSRPTRRVGEPGGRTRGRTFGPRRRADRARARGVADDRRVDRHSSVQRRGQSGRLPRWHRPSGLPPRGHRRGQQLDRRVHGDRRALSIRATGCRAETERVRGAQSRPVGRHRTPDCVHRPGLRAPAGLAAPAHRVHHQLRRASGDGPRQARRTDDGRTPARRV